MHTTFKISASQTSKIMTMPRSKKAKEAGELSEGAKTYCKTWLKEQLYTRRKSFSSKYTQKGNEMEEASIEFIGEKLELFLMKNEQFYFNTHMQGTPDIILKDTIIDVKNSWDCFTFPLLETEVPEKAYWWQLQSYMYLTNRQHAKLIYVLSNAPEHIVESEAKRAMWSAGDDDITEYYDAAYKELVYDDIADSLKIKVFEFDRDEEAIKTIFERVEACRNYIESLLKSV